MPPFIDSMKYFCFAYITALPEIMYRCTIGIVCSPRNSLRFLQNVLENRDLFRKDPVIGSDEITRLIGGSESGVFPDIELKGTYYDRKSSDTRQLMELASVAYLVRATGARQLFEFGTFVGRMTRHLALNAHPEAEVFTLDLPQELAGHPIGACYRETSESARIHQLYGDSATFDYTPWHDRIDFCWVDACHDYERVLSDTRAAFRMVREGGWIAWHDYRHSAWWSGVTKAVQETNRRINGGIVHISGTTTAVTQVTADAKEIIPKLVTR